MKPPLCKKTHALSAQNRGRPQGGYLLISLMLAFALMAIALLTVLPNLMQQIQREREEELCHRGTAYMRAIRLYYKRFGKYPTRVEDLENTNNIRFLRKRYKDPMSRDPQTGQDREFKILHMQDVVLNNGPVLGGQGQTLGALQSSVGLQMPKSVSLNSDAGVSGNPDSSNPDPGDVANLPGASSTQSVALPNSTSTANPGSSTNGSGAGAQVFGGEPIVGVVSTSKETTIREYNHKNHYNDWYFIYDPSILIPRLPIGPWRPGDVIMAGAPIMAPGQIVPQTAGQSQTVSGVTPQNSLSEKGTTVTFPNN